MLQLDMQLSSQIPWDRAGHPPGYVSATRHINDELWQPIYDQLYTDDVVDIMYAVRTEVIENL